ncbi:hypothetical protein LZ30DRAFT_722665 [Colletotrichum cereale]|nr:hypothetical protein LZ30DRAFT_722665 [Colletotrichum cereale]
MSRWQALVPFDLLVSKAVGNSIWAASGACEKAGFRLGILSTELVESGCTTNHVSFIHIQRCTAIKKIKTSTSYSSWTSAWAWRARQVQPGLSISSSEDQAF